MDTLVLQWLESPVDVDPEVAINDYTWSDIILHDCSQNYTAGELTRAT